MISGPKYYTKYNCNLSLGDNFPFPFPPWEVGKRTLGRVHSLCRGRDMATFVFEVVHEFFPLVFKGGRAIVACEYSCFSLFLTARDVLSRGTSAPQRQNFHMYSCKICPEFGQELWLVDIVVILFYLLIMHDRQKATKIECKPGCKCDQSTTKQSIVLEYNLL